VWRILGQEIPAGEYLISTGRLSEAETLQRGKVEVALGRVLADLFQRWCDQLLSGAVAPPRKSSRGNRDLMQAPAAHEYDRGGSTTAIGPVRCQDRPGGAARVLGGDVDVAALRNLTPMSASR
jgi:hypothetical protein